jgi:hypothetical protein
MPLEITHLIEAVAVLKGEWDDSRCDRIFFVVRMAMAETTGFKPMIIKVLNQQSSRSNSSV